MTAKLARVSDTLFADALLFTTDFLYLFTDQCSEDFIELYDGANIEQLRLAKLCESSLLSDIKSTGKNFRVINSNTLLTIAFWSEKLSKIFNVRRSNVFM